MAKKSISKRVIKSITLLAIFVAIVWLWPSSESTGQQFKTEPVTRGDIVQRVTANGTLNPTQIINVGTQVSGTVLKLHADSNDEVKEGQLLAELDTKLLKSQLTQSESNFANAAANYKQAQLDHERMSTLFAKNYIARAELERADQMLRTARNAMEIAKTQVERDRVNLDYAIIKSPVSGVIITREVNEGQTVAASLSAPTLFKIAKDLSEMQIDINLSEADVGNIKAGLEAKFRVDAFPTEEFTGIIRKIRLDPNTQQNVVTYTVTMDVANPEKKLLPGMTAYVTIILSSKENVLRMPSAALRFRPPVENPSADIQRLFAGRSGSLPKGVNPNVPKPEEGKKIIYVMREGVPEPVQVKTGSADGKLIEVVEGDIKEGDEVITGLQGLNAAGG